ncbi:MAG: hypothetical protein M5U34_02355 [Chloroflexi bacterium]|nr:hypothetical protein [Chloroflexota bacterium]
MAAPAAPPSPYQMGCVMWSTIRGWLFEDDFAGKRPSANRDKWRRGQHYPLFTGKHGCSE